MLLELFVIEGHPHTFGIAKAGVTPEACRFFLDFTRPLEKLYWPGRNKLFGFPVTLLVPVAHISEKVGWGYVTCGRGEPYFFELQRLWRKYYKEPRTFVVDFKADPKWDDELGFFPREALIVAEFASHFPECCMDRAEIEAGQRAITLTAKAKLGNKAALEALMTEARAGNVVAQRNLGDLYFNGQGVPQDSTQSAQWYRKAAENVDAAAQHALGVALVYGVGVPQDYRQAVQWWRKAAEQGANAAQNNLGVAYKRGQGVSPNDVVAYALFTLSAAQEPSGGGVASENRSQLAQSMTEQEIEAGQALSRKMGFPGKLLNALDQYLASLPSGKEH